MVSALTTAIEGGGLTEIDNCGEKVREPKSDIFSSVCGSDTEESSDVDEEVEPMRVSKCCLSGVKVTHHNMILSEVASGSTIAFFPSLPVMTWGFL